MNRLLFIAVTVSFLAAAAGQESLPSDQFKYSGLPAEKAAVAMTMPAGFRAHLFASEPDVRQPIAFAIDDRARVWIVEAYSYPHRQPEGEGKDRILVFEDTDGDHRFDKRTVFLDGLNLVSGIEVGFGGIWVGAAPHFMFIPVKDGSEPKPAGPPQILLDGWGFGDTHETLNTFAWGPDGWLYGCHGVFTHSNVGKPGAPDSERTRLNAGIWRYHPRKHRFELFAEGTSNPWGIDFDDFGQCIAEACVIPHLWHIVQGGRYQRQAGQHFNPNIFDDLKTIADHVHWAGGRPHAGNGRSDSAGGGHAHAGLMVYLGASWPEKYRGAVFMNNIHGARLNMDTLERKGSGYAGRHGADFLLFNDLWSQIVNLQYDQDGSLYLIDWYDRQQCHTRKADDHDRSNGRIFKVVYEGQKTTPVNLQKLSAAELVELQLKANDWWVRHARRLLQERGPDAEAHAALRKILFENPDPTRKLRALWALHASRGLTEEVALEVLRGGNEHVRAWAIQLLCEDGQPSAAALGEFARLSKEDRSPVVRLYLASAAQRITPEQLWEMVTALHGHAEDAGDQNLPLMSWYALEPLAAADFNRALGIALDSRLPRALEFTARRVGGLGNPEALSALASALQNVDDEPRQLAVLHGLSAALAGQRSVPEPKGWAAVEEKLGKSSRLEVRERAQSLSLTFGSSRALSATRRIVSDPGVAPAERRRALDSLLNVMDPALPPVLLGLLADTAMRSAALRGLAQYSDPKTPEAVLVIYPALTPPEKREALLTLASRAAFARPLLDAIAAGQIPAKEVTADIARQIRGLDQADLTSTLARLWGSARASTAEKQQEILKYKGIIAARGPAPNLSRGRAIFTRTCAQCHVLFNAGGTIGPDITGSNRADLDYLLHHIIDPNAEVPNQYRPAVIEMNDGRVITGIANDQGPKVVAVTAGTETLAVPRNEIKKITLSEFSMMPEGILTPLTNQEVRDLIAYLRSPVQTPMPVETSAK